MEVERTEGLAARAGSACRAAWESLSKGRTEGIDPADFRLGWHAAMRSIWDRLPAPEYGRDPMTPREVEKLLNYVRANLSPNDQAQRSSPKEDAGRKGDNGKS